MNKGFHRLKGTDVYVSENGQIIQVRENIRIGILLLFLILLPGPIYYLTYSLTESIIKAIIVITVLVVVLLLVLSFTKTTIIDRNQNKIFRRCLWYQKAYRGEGPLKVVFGHGVTGGLSDHMFAMVKYNSRHLFYFPYNDETIEAIMPFFYDNNCEIVRTLME
ncbi:MAG: hypothetical protein IJP27_08265 [Clostridia bacterium]|nr:hypothetical protein [Clostridia bacterium]